MAATAIEKLGEVVRASGLVEPGSRGVALLSGGPDSACLAAGLVAVLGPEAVTALHVNYGFRKDSDRDQAEMAALCERLEIRCVIDSGFGDRAPTGASEGNLQGEARDYRYAQAEGLRGEIGGAWIATGHTQTDLAETVLYRLASSPGRRAMLGLAPRRGYVVRPLLAIGRDETRRLALEAGLPFYDDPSNKDGSLRRVRIREKVLPVLREINPGAEENVAATWRELDEESEVLEALAAEALEQAGATLSTPVLRVEQLAEMQPAIRRLALRTLAGRVAGHDVALGTGRAQEIWRLVRAPEGGAVELGGGLRALCEAGLVRIVAGPEFEPQPAELTVPGSCRFGNWNVRAELSATSSQPAGPDVATLDAAALDAATPGARLEVRAWQDGDRMRPLGLEGSKSLQDLFTDSHVPRSLRHSLPVVVADDRIAWVAGVAVSEEFKLTAESTEAVVISAALAD